MNYLLLLLIVGKGILVSATGTSDIWRDNSYYAVQAARNNCHYNLLKVCKSQSLYAEAYTDATCQVVIEDDHKEYLCQVDCVADCLNKGVK